MRAVVDTNVLVSALLVPGSKPYDVVRAWDAGLFDLVTSEALTAELHRALNRPRITRRISNAPRTVDLLPAAIDQRAIKVEPAGSISVSRDPDDDRVLEAAVAGGAEYVVSGDADLLAVGQYGSIPIVPPGRFLAALILRSDLLEDPPPL